MIAKILRCADDEEFKQNLKEVRLNDQLLSMDHVVRVHDVVKYDSDHGIGLDLLII